MVREKRFFVVIAEDDPDGRDIYTEVIAKTGFPVDYVFAESGAALLHYLKQKSNPHPSLVVIDLKLPVDPLALESVREEMQSRGIPVAVITTKEREPAIRRTYCNWDECQIVKPAGIQPFQHVIEQVFARWFGPAKPSPRNPDPVRPSASPNP